MGQRFEEILPHERYSMGNEDMKRYVASLGIQFSSVQSLSRVRLFAAPWTTARQASRSSHQLPEFTQTHVHWVGDAIQPSYPLSSPSPPAPNPSEH